LLSFSLHSLLTLLPLLFFQSPLPLSFLSLFTLPPLSPFALLLLPLSLSFHSSAGRGLCLWRPVPLGLVPGGAGGLRHCHRYSDRTQGAGGRGAATGEPPPDGHQWVPAPWFPPHTSRGEWGAGCGGSGRRFGAPSGPFRCLGSSGVV
jgi:hypothetical protein